MASSAEQIRAYKGPALFSLGLRPFFLLGAIWAAIAVPLWIVTYALGPDALPVEAGLVFHVHEMVFGYGGAIVAGFLLTAVPNWTGRLPVQGKGLAMLTGVWLAGRIAMADPGSFKGVKVLVIGKAEDNERIKEAIAPSDAEYIFVEMN